VKITKFKNGGELVEYDDGTFACYNLPSKYGTTMSSYCLDSEPEYDKALINSLEERKTVREICPATKKPVEECLCSSCSQYRERRNKLLGD